MKHHLDRLAGKGVLFDEYGMLKPDIKNLAAIQQKITPDLVTLKRMLDQLRGEGKHIVYLPGSYDLLHAGHAFFIEQSVDMYLNLPEHAGLKREDVVVLVLADDDNLISRVKARKWIGAGGNEPYKRPIQSEETFRTVMGEGHWRLFEIASIPQVDIVGFIPSPISAEHLGAEEVLAAQKNAAGISAALESFKSTRAISPEDISVLEKSIRDYDSLIESFRNGHKEAAQSFSDQNSAWSIQAWQLFIHIYLGSGNFIAPFSRIISHNDSAYKDQVAFLMEISGLKGIYIQDESLISTTDLLAEHGHEKLIEAKSGNYR